MKKVLVLAICIGIASAVWADLPVEPNGFSLGGKNLKAGGMELTFQSGRAVPVSVDGKRLGFLFSGEASYALRVTDRFSRQVLPYNLKNGSHLEGPEGLLRDEAGTVLCVGRAAAALVPETTSPEAPFDAEIKMMEDRFLSQGIFSPLSFAAAGLANGTDELACLIAGKKDDAIFVYDPVWRQEEWLWTLETSLLRRSGASNLRYAHRIVEQPVGLTRIDPKIPALMLTELKFDMDFRELGAMKGKYALNLKVQRGGLSAVQLDLVNFYTYIRAEGQGSRGLFHEETFTEGVEYHTETKFLHVDSVAFPGGAALPYLHDGDLLTVFLPQPAAKGQTLRLQVEVHGDIFEPTPAMGHYIVLSGLSWFPAPCDGTEAVEARFAGTVRTKLPLRAFASVDDFTVTEKDGQVVFEGRNSTADDYLALAIGKYFPKTMTVAGLDVTVASAVFANDKAYKLLSNLTEGVLDVYKFYLDAFPYKHLFLVEGRGLGWGHAPPAMVFASGEIFNSLKDEDTQLFSGGANERFAHEIAHQYYGHLVMDKSAGDAWLTEAASEYMAAVFLKQAKFPKMNFKSAYNFWYSRVKTTGQYASPYAAGLLAGDEAGYYYWDQIYCKGPVVLHAIRDKVGDNTFFTVLRSFLKSFPHKKVTTEDFIGLLNYITKEEWHPFFDRYVYGTELPEKSNNVK